MATIKRTKAKKEALNDDAIISLYMTDVLEANEEPKNAFVFCKKHNIEESDFYSFFGSLDAVKQSIWVKFFENAVATIEKEEAFNSYSDKNKLLTLNFTLFEILTLNRSYVLFTLKENKEGLKNLKNLKEFRNRFKDYIVNEIKSKPSEPFGKVAKVTEPVFSEGAWLQFLFILKFWMDDTSKGFEKTDVLIEKSVNTAVDLLDTKPLESLFDLGKFLWKEKMQ
ncbi:TetR/AcrR family transcriptional regulator [Flavobacterium sp. J49]|uniref:TetR family transcriptional regulator C-terminal domain-containing protein n=1 Tax=Flavobacterium sp. J49 TaxID=2718534 RepID=UPI0015943B6A|nr:TetR family transcriptional regulator C-terminal domain-containing protein [Flavobacterium sp. J49]MBF6641110.1 TetR/AcrR family transcriptional regulator [Flavobacterium sp. J49]NIC02357.1 TetR/AcrR family transcriptional regulator [Flavobacterium sp. J49]